MGENKEFHYEIDKDFDYTIDEKGNTYISLRKIKWGDRGDFRLDLRKYISTEQGERMQKGVSFLTDDGPNELVKVLLNNDYGKPDEVAEVICDKRKDIFDAISNQVNGIFPKSLDNTEETEQEELFEPGRLFDDD